MSPGFDDRLAAELGSKERPCATCRALDALTDEQLERFKVARASLKTAPQARVLDVNEATYRAHIAKNHVDPR